MSGSDVAFDDQKGGGVSNADAHDEFLSDASTDGDGSFSLDKFYTASSDKKGKQTTIRMHVPPSLLCNIQELVARRTIPEYKTSQDVLRDFLVVGCHYRLDQIDDPGFTRNCVIMQVRGEMQTIIAEQQSEKTAVDEIKAALDGADNAEEKRAVRERGYRILAHMKIDSEKRRLELILA